MSISSDQPTKKTETGELLCSFQVTTADGTVLQIEAPILDQTILTASLSKVTRIGRAPAAHSSVETADAPPLYSRFDLIRRNFRKFPTGYVEVLEVIDAPLNHARHIIHEKFVDRGRAFSEWKSGELATYAFNVTAWPITGSTGKLESLAGFIRHIHCHRLTPWFLATGTEAIIGPYVAPRGLDNDPVYRLGGRFVCFDPNDGEDPVIKTCLGCRVEKGFNVNFPFEPYEYRIVYFDDGSVWKSNSKIRPPRELSEGELWVVHRLGHLKRLMTGGLTNISVHFLDSTTLSSRIVHSKLSSLKQPGLYRYTIVVEGEKPIFRNKKFEPSETEPTLLHFINNQMKENGKNVLYVKIREIPGQKRSHLTFFNRTLFL
jgi:hypothetical protein